MSEVRCGVFAIIILAVALAALQFVDEGWVVPATVVALAVLLVKYYLRRSAVV